MDESQALGFKPKKSVTLSGVGGGLDVDSHRRYARGNDLRYRG